MAYMKKGLFLLALAWCVGNASATGVLSLLGGFKLASELLVAPLGGAVRGSSSSATENRKKARAAAKDTPPPVAENIILVVPEEEVGVITPSRVGSPTDNRAKARDYLSGTDSGNSANVRILNDAVPDGSETNQNSLERNRAKARRYSDGSSSSGSKAGTFVKIGTSVGVVGPDGVIVLVCDDTNNIAGHIGDDTQSGNVFAIVVNGKLAKARCK